jgi:hypothetical protein
VHRDSAAHCGSATGRRVGAPKYRPDADLEESMGSLTRMSQHAVRAERR